MHSLVHSYSFIHSFIYSFIHASISHCSPLALQLVKIPASVTLPPCFARRFRLSPSSSCQRRLVLEWLKVAPVAHLRVVAATPDHQLGLLYDVDLLNFPANESEATQEVENENSEVDVKVWAFESRSPQPGTRRTVV